MLVPVACDLLAKENIVKIDDRLLKKNFSCFDKLSMNGNF